jgi:cyclophilin family peptidyl-prolyl cis-trans isomerase
MAKRENMYLLIILTIMIGLLCSPVLSGQAQAQKESERTIAVFETTKGSFTVELYDDLAPITSGNFKKLVSEKFYDGTIFHRVIDEFMIQGGDPTGTGTGDPGYSIEDEFGPGLIHDGPGVLSMANAGPNTGGSQFFITLVPTPHLDGRHAIFGHVVSGMDVVEAIGKVETNRGDRPLTEVKIERLYLQTK